MQSQSNHPAAWQGPELFRRADWLQELTADEQTELLAWAQDAPGSSTPRLSGRLRQMQHDLEEASGACLLKGFPIDALTAEQVPWAFDYLARQVGTPVSQTANGDLILSVRDEGYQVGSPQARGPNTRKRLSFHTDRCDVIAFLCLQQAKSGGDNQLVSSMAIYQQMLRKRPDLVEVLSQPFYYRRHNVDTGNDRPWCRQPIFSFCEGHFAASYLRLLIDRAYELPELPAMTDSQREALDTLEAMAADPSLHVQFRLERGDVLFLNNWVTLHRRDEFEDFPDPSQRRHLLRIWLAVPNSRPLDPSFADNFGATEAGAIRGGMRPIMGN